MTWYIANTCDSTKTKQTNSPSAFGVLNLRTYPLTAHYLLYVLCSSDYVLCILQVETVGLWKMHTQTLVTKLSPKTW